MSSSIKSDKMYYFKLPREEITRRLRERTAGEVSQFKADQRTPSLDTGDRLDMGVTGCYRRVPQRIE